MERTEFQQMMAELKEKSERRCYETLRKKYATAPDFAHMSLRDEIGARYDLDELEQLKQKFGMSTGMPADNALVGRMRWAEARENDKYRKYISKYLPNSFVQSYDVLKAAKDEMDIVNTSGADNYYHSVGMCQNAQDGRPFSTIMMGVGKELYDFAKKMKEGKPVTETLLDNAKDIENNIRGVYYGVKYPNQSCRDIFQSLDWTKNTMR